MDPSFELALLKPRPIDRQESYYNYRYEYYHSSETIGTFYESFFTYYSSDRKEFIFESESYEENCLKCPPNAECGFNTTLETLGIPQNYWRASKDTAVFTPVVLLIRVDAEEIVEISQDS